MVRKSQPVSHEACYKNELAIIQHDSIKMIFLQSGHSHLVPEINVSARSQNPYNWRKTLLLLHLSAQEFWKYFVQELKFDLVHGGGLKLSPRGDPRPRHR